MGTRAGEKGSGQLDGWAAATPQLVGLPQLFVSRIVHRPNFELLLTTKPWRPYILKSVTSKMSYFTCFLKKIKLHEDACVAALFCRFRDAGRVSFAFLTCSS